MRGEWNLREWERAYLRLFYCGRTFRMELMLADKEDY